MVEPLVSFQSQTWATKFLRQVVAGEAGFLQLPLDHDLRGDARVVGARHPERVLALHPVVAHQRVHDGVLEGVAHVQRARDVGRRQLDAERRLGGIERRLVDAALFPERAPMRLDGGGVEGFGEFGHGGA